MLRVKDTIIVDDEGREVILRGAGLGGWMNMENFISGYPACEFQIREALAEVIGTERSEFFFDKFLEYFFQEDDAIFFKSLGLNCIRIAFNHKHFEDDTNPRVLKMSGFKHLDRVIDLCARHGIYTILDLHTVPGGQNGGWHSDHGTHLAAFWTHKDHQDRAIWLWEQLAECYKDNPWIAGYNPLNEPACPSGQKVVDWYDRVEEAIRNIDKEHIIFLDGNTYASDFSEFGDAHKRWSNTAYSIHDYSIYGFPAAPEPYERTEEQLRRVKKSYDKKREWMDERGLCVWNGEWGPVYARKQHDGPESDAINERRFAVLEDQLQIYNKDRISWTIWLYKDIGFQGMVHVKTSTPYMTLFKDFLLKKHRMAVDTWGADATRVANVYRPLIDHIREEIDEKYIMSVYPAAHWKLEGRVTRLARNMLIGEFMVKEWAEHFRGKSEDELDELAQSFKFQNCEKRGRLNGILTRNADFS